MWEREDGLLYGLTIGLLVLWLYDLRTEDNGDGQLVKDAAAPGELPGESLTADQQLNR